MRPQGKSHAQMRVIQDRRGCRPGVTVVAMTAPPLSRFRGLWATGLASLIPRAAFVVAIAIADVSVDYKSVSLVGLVTGAPSDLAMVALPSLLALSAAPIGVLRMAVLVVMTAVAAMAGVLVMTTDDGQAGFAVFWVPFVAIPLAAVLRVGRAVAAWGSPFRR